MNSNFYNTRTAIRFSTGWQPTWEPSFSHPDEPKTVRGWQERALAKTLNKSFASIYGPPSTGKGFFTCISAHLTLENSPNLRAIIVAPQRNITKDLRKQDFIHPTTNKIVNWKPSLYLNDTSKNTQSNSKAFHQWASRTDYVGVNDRVCVMTHQSLCRIFSDNSDSTVFKNMILFLDEYHHVFLSDEVPSNKLGEVLKYFIEHHETQNLRTCMLTATPFRGDRLAPIPKEFLSKFVEFEHPMDEAMPDFAPLQQFSLDFVLYKKNWRKAIEKLVGKQMVPSLFYIPNVGSAYSFGTKNDDVKEIYCALAGTKTPKIKQEGVYTLVWRAKEKRWLRCIDLVDDSVNREPKLQAITDDHEMKVRDKNSIDAVIALDMLVEGSNWRWIVDEYIIGNHDSLREFIQMYGRLFRSAPNKISVHCHYLLAYSSEYEMDDYMENFNKYLVAVFSTLILVNVLQPQLVSTLEKQSSGENIRINYLNKTFSSTEFQRYVEEAQEAILNASLEHNIDINLSEGKTNITHEQMNMLKSSLDAVLNDFGVHEFRKQIKNETIRLFKIASIVPMMDLTGLDVSKINYDFIEASNVHPLACMVRFGSGMRDIDTLRDLRKITDEALARFEEFVEALKEHKEKAQKEGILV